MSGLVVRSGVIRLEYSVGKDLLEREIIIIGSSLGKGL